MKMLKLCTKTIWEYTSAPLLGHISSSEWHLHFQILSNLSSKSTISVPSTPIVISCINSNAEETELLRPTSVSQVDAYNECPLPSLFHSGE